MSERDSLKRRISALEQRLGDGSTARRRMTSRKVQGERPTQRTAAKTLLAEIEELEQQLDPGVYVEEDELGMDEFSEPAPAAPVVVDELGMDDSDELGMDGLGEEEALGELGMDDMDEDDMGLEDGLSLEDELGCDGMGPDMLASEDGGERKSSEEDPNGVEEDISQDYLSDVQGERHGEELATAGSVRECVARLVRAKKRLDRLADYLEKNGRKRMAFKVDQVSDAIDARIAKMRRA